MSPRRRGPSLGSRLRGRTRKCTPPFRRTPTCWQIPAPAYNRPRPPSRHPSESWDLPDRVATLANRDTPASAGATSGARSNRSECRRRIRTRVGIRTRIPIRIQIRVGYGPGYRFGYGCVFGKQYQREGIAKTILSGSPGTAARRFSPSRRLCYITPICQRRIMIEAFLPHRSVERRRPDLSADRARPEAAPATQNTRTSERNHAASKPPRRPRETPQKMLRERLHFLYFTFPA